MKQIINFILAFLLTSFLQFALAHKMMIQGVRPDFFLPFLLFFSLQMPLFNSLLLGFLVGLHMDLFFPMQLGINIFSKSAIGHFSNLMRDRINQHNVFPQIFLTAILSFLQKLIEVFIGGLPGNLPLWKYLLANAIPFAVYTALVACFYFPLLHLIMRFEIRFPHPYAKK